MLTVENDDYLKGENDMTKPASVLYGSTSKTGSVPNVCNAGPVLSEDGALILSESFTDMKPITDMAQFEADLQTLLSGDDYVESWRIWDCYEQEWADTTLELHRFEMHDLVVRRQGNAACLWRGAINTHARVLTSTDPEENEAKCWQWLRVKPRA